MYTQCPECGVAFRVTAEVLRQAAGKVRCGGCGVAFNALEHLSEQKPQAPVRSDPEPKVPELTPEEPGELEADTPPQSISAAQSAALLKTLDQLAGSDIRIEDTGIEWRVLEDDEEQPESEAAEAQAIEEAEEQLEDSDLIADTGSLKFFIEDDDKDEPVEEMRFDDNTPLPDDFDVDAPTPAPEPLVVEEPEPVDDMQDAQAGLELGDPDEWEDLLEEVVEPVAEETPAEEAESEVDEEPLAEAQDESADDIVVLSDTLLDDPPDMDTQFAIQAEAMGIDLSGLHELEEEDEPEEEEAPETSIDDDLIAAAFEAEAAARDSEPELEEEEEPEAELEEEEEPEAELEEEEEPEAELEEEEEPDAELEGEEEPESELEEDEEEETPDTEFEAEFEEDDDIAQPIAELGGQPVDERLLEITLDDEDAAEEPVVDEQMIPEMTEEEMTINMLIDQDLLSIAVEDEDGFASTIVQRQPDKNIEDEIDDFTEDDIEVETLDEAPAKVGADAKSKGHKKSKKKVAKAPQPFETIIMEGNVVRGETDQGRDKKNLALGERIKAKKAKEEQEQQRDSEARDRRKVMLAGAAALVLLLLVQVVHQSRESLATNPAFRDTVGPLYRMVGKPVTPAYDITGWRFEQTKNNIGEADGVLSIYSRIGNNSDKALPYPLINVSLTNRFEDPVGSRVLEPGEYLASDTDPRELVAAGNTFDAVISIESPDAEATGFKLNVCYRMESGLLGCAIEDFK